MDSGTVVRACSLQARINQVLHAVRQQILRSFQAMFIAALAADSAVLQRSFRNHDYNAGRSGFRPFGRKSYNDRVDKGGADVPHSYVLAYFPLVRTAQPLAQSSARSGSICQHQPLFVEQQSTGMRARIQQYEATRCCSDPVQAACVRCLRTVMKIRVPGVDVQVCLHRFD